MSRRWAWLLLLSVPLGVALADLVVVSAVSGSGPPATLPISADEARSLWLACAVVVSAETGRSKSFEIDLLARRPEENWQIRAVVRQPQAISGVDLLVSPDLTELALYLPTFGRTNHVSGSALQGSALGTDLQFRDLLEPELWTEGQADDRLLDRSGSLVLDGVELPAELHVRNLAKGTSTTVRVLGGAVDRDLPDEWFTTGHLGSPLPRPPGSDGR